MVSAVLLLFVALTSVAGSLGLPRRSGNLIVIEKNPHGSKSPHLPILQINNIKNTHVHLGQKEGNQYSTEAVPTTLLSVLVENFLRSKLNDKTDKKIYSDCLEELNSAADTDLIDDEEAVEEKAGVGETQKTENEFESQDDKKGKRRDTLERAGEEENNDVEDKEKLEDHQDDEEIDEDHTDEEEDNIEDDDEEEDDTENENDDRELEDYEYQDEHEHEEEHREEEYHEEEEDDDEEEDEDANGQEEEDFEDKTEDNYEEDDYGEDDKEYSNETEVEQDITEVDEEEAQEAEDEVHDFLENYDDYIIEKQKQRGCGCQRKEREEEYEDYIELIKAKQEADKAQEDRLKRPCDRAMNEAINTNIEPRFYHSVFLGRRSAHIPTTESGGEERGNRQLYAGDVPTNQEEVIAYEYRPNPIYYAYPTPYVLSEELI